MTGLNDHRLVDPLLLATCWCERNFVVRATALKAGNTEACGPECSIDNRSPRQTKVYKRRSRQPG